ncbi:helix-turn-helix domain-containing protein [Alicyclobacillus fastidiosus]|uniref:helix-turn-helix domain-containing protein n=1 Tax=Alicyclobacillus fastidiosus TaxID=392011 RepID=UPI0023E9FB31|nr:hypothetical protein GCM10025859_39330 [Alicyclobacillus fastidiosus]
MARNVREIQHVVEQLVVLADSDTINPQDLPVNLRSESLFKKTGSKNLNEIIKNVESEIIKEAWRQLGDINMVAEQLGIHRTTLVRKINKLGLILK